MLRRIARELGPAEERKEESHDNHIHISGGDGHKTRKMLGDVCGIQSFLVLATVESANQKAQRKGETNLVFINVDVIRTLMVHSTGSHTDIVLLLILIGPRSVA